MANKISYRYEALNEESFNSLVSKIITCGAILKINPNDKSVIAEIDAEQFGSKNDPIREIGSVIDDNALDFHITHLESVDFTEQIESLKNELDLTRKDLAKEKRDSEFYSKSFNAELERMTGIKKQIESIGLLLELIRKS